MTQNHVFPRYCTTSCLDPFSPIVCYPHFSQGDYILNIKQLRLYSSCLRILQLLPMLSRITVSVLLRPSSGSACVPDLISHIFLFSLLFQSCLPPCCFLNQTHRLHHLPLYLFYFIASFGCLFKCQVIRRPPLTTLDKTAPSYHPNRLYLSLCLFFKEHLYSTTKDDIYLHICWLSDCFSSLDCKI